MRSVIWLFILFVAAVAAALFLGDNRATVTVFWYPYRVDMSLNLLLLMLLVLAGLVTFAIRAFSSVKKVQLSAKQWHQQQQERSLQHQFLEATEQYAQGNYQQAGEVAVQAITKAQQILVAPSEANDEAATALKDWARSVQIMAHWVAAESAYALGNEATGDAHYITYQESHVQN